MAWLLAVAVLAAVVRAEVVVSTRPQKLYGAVSPKMRIQGTGMTGPASDIQLTFVPSLAAAAYNLTKIKNQDGACRAPSTAPPQRPSPLFFFFPVRTQAPTRGLA